MSHHHHHHHRNQQEEEGEGGGENACDDVVIGCWPFRGGRRRRRHLRRSSKGPRGDANLLVQTTTKTATSCSHPNPPRLVNIRREASPLLTACWNQDWDRVLTLLETTQQVYHRSHNTGRTALHLATIPGAQCPTHVLRAIVRANPVAVVTEDFHQYGGTPLHFCCGSVLRQQPDLCRFMVETALEMHEKYPTSTDDNNSNSNTNTCHVRLSYWSPLFQAARWAAPAATLQVLVQASRAHAWIGPWTGAEAWTMTPVVPHGATTATRPPLRCDSPLYELWRRNPGVFQNPDPPSLVALRRITEDYFAAEDPWQFWCDRFPNQSLLEDHYRHDNNDHDPIPDDSGACCNAALVQWCKVLVLLRDQATQISDLLPTVVALHATIPALVRLVTLLWPAQVLRPSEESGRWPLHTAVARYRVAAAAAAATAFSDPSTWDGQDAALVMVEIVARAQPGVLVVPDPVSGLPPAWEAALCDAPVDLIYQLLRPAPARLIPVGGYIPEEKRTSLVS